MTSCSKDIDSNPTLQEPTTFHLNTPALALGGNVYDLEKGETLNLTTSQPDYGFPLATTYQVQISLNKNFSDKDVEGVEYTTLESTYNKANMNVDAQEINNAVVEMFLDNNPGVSPSGVIMPIYVRLRAHITNSDRGYINSNVIEIPKVVVGYVASLPKNIFLAGSSIRNGESVKQLAQISGSKNEDFFGMFYVGENGSIKWGASTKANKGYKDATVNCNATGVTVSEAADGGIKFDKAGWYTIHLNASLDKANNKVDYTANIYPAKAYIMGAAAGNAWNDGDAEWELTPGANASEMFVSPAFAGSGELRAYIKIPGYEWWKTEFTLYSGNIFWREQKAINSNWASDLGAEYSVTCAPGQKLYIDFDNDKGEVK
jgi:hypothetical protein